MIVEINTGIKHSRIESPIYLTAVPEPTEDEKREILITLNCILETRFRIPYTRAGAALVETLLNEEWRRVSTREQSIKVSIE